MSRRDAGHVINVYCDSIGAGELRCLWQHSNLSSRQRFRVEETGCPVVITLFLKIHTFWLRCRQAFPAPPTTKSPNSLQTVGEARDPAAHRRQAEQCEPEVERELQSAHPPPRHSGQCHMILRHMSLSLHPEALNCPWLSKNEELYCELKCIICSWTESPDHSEQCYGNVLHVTSCEGMLRDT